MKEKTVLILMAAALLLFSVFSAFGQDFEDQVPGDANSGQSYEEQFPQDPENPGDGNVPVDPDQTENPDPVLTDPGNQENPSENTAPGPEPEPTQAVEENPEPETPEWQDIDEDQVEILRMIYDEMTGIGKAYSGWFAENDYAPCSWNGISCEDRQVSGLDFENAGYFRVFPESILYLRGLKVLTMIDTLVCGPLPDALFSSLPKLEILELSGNFLTGEIPALPDAFELYPAVRQIIICDNLEDDRKLQLMGFPEYGDVAYSPSDTDMTPGLYGEIPGDWDRLPSLYAIDLSGNQLRGSVPDSFGSLSLGSLDLSNNAEPFAIADWLYESWSSLQNPAINLDGIQTPVNEEPQQDPEPEPESPDDVNINGPLSDPDNPPAEEPYIPPAEDPYTPPTEEPYIPPAEDPYIPPTEEPYIPPVEVPYIPPTEVPYIPPTEVPYIPPTEVPYVPPAEVPYIAPTQVPPAAVPAQPTPVPPTPQTIFVVVTATPRPQWYTATPVSYNPQPYYYPTATPYYQQPYYIYPTATPYYQQPYYTYPTATPYYYNPSWVYPTATSSYNNYQQYVQNPQSPTRAPEAAPTQDQAALLGFTYKLESMTENNIPMTWRYTGMQDYSIVYLDAAGNLYPAFAMPWTGAGEICNSSVCNASVSVPDELLQQGRFSLQLRVRDASGKTYNSDPVEMEVTLPAQPTPTPVPEQPKSFLAGFFEWLFGPIIRLFGGGK